MDDETDTKPRALAFIDRARDVLTVKRVFGEPVERDGVTVIPAANVRGGGGGGSGPEGSGGSGGGFGISASPAGAYVIRDGDVRWEPAFNLNRTIFMGQIVAIVFLLTVRRIAKLLAKR
ncbi:MAG: sporulation protein [Chloroflexi bacterium]|nr:sporulation protein [Chloroflexota bacterium]